MQSDEDTLHEWIVIALRSGFATVEVAGYLGRVGGAVDHRAMAALVRATPTLPVSVAVPRVRTSSLSQTESQSTSSRKED